MLKQLGFLQTYVNLMQWFFRPSLADLFCNSQNTLWDFACDTSISLLGNSSLILLSCYCFPLITISVLAWHGVKKYCLSFYPFPPNKSSIHICCNQCWVNHDTNGKLVPGPHRRPPQKAPTEGPHKINHNPYFLV